MAEQNISAFTVADFDDVARFICYRMETDIGLDELGRRFAAPSNAFAIHREISKAVHKVFGVWIPKQDSMQLAELMSAAYRDFLGIARRSGDTDEDLYALNSAVVDAALPGIVANIEMGKKQMAEFDRVPVPIALPVNASSAGLDGRKGQVTVDRFLPVGDRCQPPPTAVTTWQSPGMQNTE